MLILVAIVLALVGAYAIWRRNPKNAVTALVGAALVFLWYETTDTIPAEFVTYSPQIITLFALSNLWMARRQWLTAAAASSETSLSS